MDDRKAKKKRNEGTLTFGHTRQWAGHVHNSLCHCAGMSAFQMSYIWNNLLSMATTMMLVQASDVVLAEVVSSRIPK